MVNTLERNQPTIEYEAGRTKKIDLPREHYYEALNLVLDATVTTGTSASKNGNGILDLIEQVKVEYNGSKTPKSQSFAMSHFVDYYEYGSRPRLDEVDYSVASQQDVLAQSFVQFLLEPRHLATPLPSFLFSTLTLEIKWADASAIGSDVTVDSAAVKVESTERKRSSIEDESSVLDNLMVFKETEMTRSIDSEGSTQIDLPQGNVYHSIPTLVVDNGSPNDALVESYEIVENTVDTHAAVDWDMQQSKDYAMYRVEEPETGFAIPGYAVGGDISDAVDTSGMDSYNYVLETGAPTGDAYAQVVTRELIL